MDGEADLEMPSPKRMRLEASKQELSNDVPPQVDRLDDLYGAPPARAETSSMFPQIHAPNQATPLSSTIPKPIHLPGLKLLNDEPSISNGSQKPMLDHKVVNEWDMRFTDGEGQCGSAKKEDGNKFDLNGRRKITPEQTSDPTTGKSGLSDSVPTAEFSQANVNLMEDVVIKAVTPEQQVLERTGEPQLDERLQETTNLAPEALVQTEVQNDEPPISEGSPARAIGLSTNIEARRKGVQEENVTEDADDSKQEEVPQFKIVDKLSETTGLSNPTFEEVAEANKSKAEAEFEVDSSPYESCSSDFSTDSSSSDDSEDDNDADDYEMLSPEEEARRLMAEDGNAEEKTISGIPRTLNEKPDEVVPKPQISVTADMMVEELGRVENLVENLVLIKANISGEYQVLESGSVLCLEDRSVIGVIAETLGRVHQPYYSVRFSNTAAIEEAGIIKNTKVYYVTQHSTTVFTQPLKAYKGSDASNLHDEEAGDNELEFSDDEAEAEHKRQVKLQKRARYDIKHGHDDSVVGGPQPRPGVPDSHPNGRLNAWPEYPPNPAELALNYDDAGEDSDDLYTPLARPSNLHEMVARKDGLSENNPSRGNANRGGRGKGRGDRGGGRGGGGGRGQVNGRGERPDRRGQNGFRGNSHPHAHPRTGEQPSPISQSNGFNPSPNISLPPRPSHQSNGSHTHPQTQNLSMQLPPYPAHSSSQPHTHPNYASQYSQTYSPPYPQQYQQPQYQYQDPYLQGISRQGYHSQQAFSPSLAYSVQQIPPTPPSPAAIPPGAHINPSFFRQQAQSSPQPWYPQQGQGSSPPQQYQQYQQPSPANSNAGALGGMSPESARRLQENLNMPKDIGPHGGAGR